MKLLRNCSVVRRILLSNFFVLMIFTQAVSAASIGSGASPSPSPTPFSSGTSTIKDFLASASVYTVEGASSCNVGDSLATFSDIDFALNYALEVDVLVYYLTNALSHQQLPVGKYALVGISNAAVTCSISATKSCMRTIRATSGKSKSDVKTVGFLCVKSRSAVATRMVQDNGSGFGEGLKNLAPTPTPTSTQTSTPIDYLPPVPPPCTSPDLKDCYPTTTPDNGADS